MSARMLMRRKRDGTLLVQNVPGIGLRVPEREYWRLSGIPRSAANPARFLFSREDLAS